MAVNRERKTISAYTNTDMHLEWLTLKKAAEQIQRLISLYGEDAEIRMRGEDYSDREYLAVYQNRLETDKELARRIQEEEDWEARQAKRDADDYARLKAKFGSQ
ncbi:hypothetical protein UFOVP29_123 [uncultured Caudovirales phage]|uniref:Uncharacterized protein n=1 Tax=uncultured Caudovirales phage TaxID=2100421 RepID=A0A6J5KL18_9CAUD|nr:hypothetical protein UFOVP29_123 [uncultured Caudovirales phage]